MFKLFLKGFYNILKIIHTRGTQLLMLLSFDQYFYRINNTNCTFTDIWRKNSFLEVIAVRITFNTWVLYKLVNKQQNISEQAAEPIAKVLLVKSGKNLCSNNTIKLMQATVRSCDVTVNIY